MIAPVVWSATSGVPGTPHLVLVHGSLDRSAGLLKLSRRLDDRFLVTRYDRRGYGRSTPCRGPYGIDAQIDDIVSVIEHVPDAGRPRVIVGHSYGGNVALGLADRRPDLVDGVVTYESPMSWEPWWPSDTAGGGAVAWRDDPGEAAERFMRRLIGDDRWNRLPPSTRAARRAEGVAMVGELIDLRAGAPWSADRISVPVIAVRGEHGAAHHRESVAVLARRLRDVEVVSIAGAKHFGPNTHPDAVAAVVVGLVVGAMGRISEQRRP